MLRPVIHAALAAAALLLPAAGAQAAGAPAAGVLELVGSGVQIYRCQAAGASFAWAARGPEAALATADGQPAGRHFAGPTWQATDGSAVVGEVVGAGSATPGGGPPDAVPWLVLRATSHAGDGRLSGVTYITRTRTVGGLAPVSGCDAANVDREARVGYSATYTFFGVQ